LPPGGRGDPRPGGDLEHRGDADFQPIEITDDSMDKLAKAMGCAVEAMTFEPYPG